MEARSFFENSSMAEITVTATKEEWQGVIQALMISDVQVPDAENLVDWLINQGVYE